MDAVQHVASPVQPVGLQYLDRLFGAVKKTTVIELRWPLVISCAYLLLYSQVVWLTPIQIEVLLIFYLLTNATLYFVADEYFESPYFYGPLLVFDTAFLAIVLAVSGGANPSFYVACCLTLALSCICNDSRGLLVVTILAPLVYGYIVFNSAGIHDPTIYLRALFPLVIAIFYGYFAQVERLKRVARENEQHAWREHQAAEEIRRQQERLELLKAANVAVASSTAYENIPALFLQRASARLPYAAMIFRWQNPETGAMETAAIKGMNASESEKINDALKFVDEIDMGDTPLVIHDLTTDARVAKKEIYRRHGLASLLAVPIIAQKERLGTLVFLSRGEQEFAAEEIGFLASLGEQAAAALHYCRLLAQGRQQANELRHANRVKDEFLGVVSHELKTPLNVISGYANMLLERMLGEVSPIQEKALQTIAHESKELNDLINRVLQVSSIEAHTVQAEFHEVNSWELLSELRVFYDYPLGKDVKLVWQFPPDLPTLQTDRSKLKHILENLINNAIKFTEKGRVTICAKYSAAKKCVEFKVADTGIGIPTDQVPLIFERFRQLDASETRPYSGVGLGLYIASQYTALIGGALQVDSTPGEGSVFTLRIPCTAKQTKAMTEQLSLLATAENA